MKFRLGVNYWPVSSAMYWWKRFDADEVEQDFARSRKAGFDNVRAFLLWEDFLNPRATLRRLYQAFLRERDLGGE